MKLTIDTKEDSKEEIRKAIRMLSAIVEDSEIYTNRPEKVHYPNIFESSSEPSEPEAAKSEPVSGGLFGMFGNTSSSPAAESGKEKEETEKKPQIQIIDY
ncbi:hypothetical protein JW707_03570 [Candidatus Woesearchaeota archaeon]|nr:hypothetical protein [Candidatus Woesearchaeota archaeon]